MMKLPEKQQKLMLSMTTLSDSFLDFAYGAASGKGGVQNLKAAIKYLKLDEYIVAEDPNTSCKSRNNGVKCLKIKKGKHFKPFYISSERW